LFSSLPEEHKKNKAEINDISAAAAGGGCLFYPRCPEAKPECGETVPELKEINGGHKVSCINLK